MNRIARRIRHLVLAAVCMLPMLAASPAFASDASDVHATIRKWVSDLNKGDMKSVISACAAHTAVVDGFPPYAWSTCADWIKGYEANNKAIQGSHGVLSIGTPIYTEFRGDSAYVIYPATFTDVQKGKSVVYRGIWTMTLQRVPGGWVFTGNASAWGVNSL